MPNGTNLPPEATKKGLSPLAWVGIGCGVIVVCGFVLSLVLGAFALRKGKGMVSEATGGVSISELVDGLKENPVRFTAETAIRLNPDLELLSTNDGEGTITFRNQKTGEEATLHFEEIAEGRFGLTTEDGDFSYSIEDAGGEGGVTITTPDGEARFGATTNLDDVPSWVITYPDATSNRSSFHSSSGGTTSGILAGQTEDSAGKVMDYYPHTEPTPGS